MKYLRISSFSILKIGLCIWCFGIALPIHYQTTTLLLFVVAWLLSGNYKEKFRRIFSAPHRKLMFLPIAFYLLHVVGLTYSTDFDYAFLDLSIKLPLLIVPFLLATLPEEMFQKKHVKALLWSFLAGVTVFILFCFGKALYNIFVKDLPYRTCLFYAGLSPIIHVAYVSMYSCLGILILCFKGKQLFTVRTRWLHYFLFICFILFITFADTRAGVFSLLIVLLGCFLNFLNQPKQILIGVSLVIGLILMFFTLQTALPGYGHRFETTVEYIVTKLKIKRIDRSENTEAYEKHQQHLNILTQTGEVKNLFIRDDTRCFTKTLWKENFVFGVGTGDFKHDLQRKYKEAGMKYMEKHYLNAHQQYLQTGATLGTVGFILLITVIIVPIIHGIKHRHWTVVLFFIIYAFNLGFESVLERQMGVHILCFAYLICMLLPKTEDFNNGKA